MPKSKVLPGRTTIKDKWSAPNKITSRKSQSNELQRGITDKILSGSKAIKKDCKGVKLLKRTAREYHNKRYCQGVSRKILPVSVTISLYGIHPQLLKLIIIKTTARPRKCKIKLMSRERNNQKNYPITKLKGLPGSVAIKRTAKDNAYHKQKER